ncbi:MAG: hypothetical protein JWM14_2214 [Chitinophagaceae bacterium]|nr:hypothetical protein [Chitinophagaceae bacterium]
MNKLFFLFLLSPLALFAQTNSMTGKYIKGTVKNRLTQEPVKQALIRVSLGDKLLESALTNEAGEFKIGLCSCYYDSLITLSIDQEKYLLTQYTFMASEKEAFEIGLAYDYRVGMSKAAFKELSNRAFYTRQSGTIQWHRFYINCVGEIKQGKEIKANSEQNWELTEIGNFGQ